jgi:NADPH-dependent ferric siderophore reductase
MSAVEARLAEDIDPLAPRRVRHEPRRRTLQVTRVDRLTPHMIRVTLGGDLDGFTSLGFDDHVKLFFPNGTGANGEPLSEARDYTPHRYDAANRTLEIDFAIHDAGPATRWATDVRLGQSLNIGGPRGSLIVPLNYDWHLFMGDETGLPAISRRLLELPLGARAVVFAEVDGPADELTFETKANVDITWVHRNGTAAGTTTGLSTALKSAKLPKGTYYAWVACESLIAKALRAQLLADHGANKRYMRCAGYWRRGAVAVHDTIND